MCMPLPSQYTSLETETIAIEKRVLLAKEMGLQQIMLETDAPTVAQSLAAGTRMAALAISSKGLVKIQGFLMFGRVTT